MLPRTYPTVEGARGERRVSVKLLTAPQGQAGIDYIPVAPVQGANPPPESNTDNSSDSGGMLMTTLAYAEGAQEWIDYIPVFIDGPQPSFSLEALVGSTPDALAFTRATACSGIDYQGNVFQALSGEMTRQGLRRVRNLFSASTTLSTQGVTVEVGAVYVVSFYGTGSITFTGAATGSLSGTGATTRVSTTVTATTTTLTCTVAGSVTSAQCQRARPGQTEPDEYVSTGVLASPYHGSYVDGVRYFDTDENGAKITGTGAGYDRDGTGAWVRSSSVAPIEVGIPVIPAQTNRITYSTPVTGWTTGTATATAAYDAQVGAYAQLRNVGAEGVAAVYIASSGFTGDARTEIAFMMRTVTATGSATVKNPQGAANGLWIIDLTKVSTTRFERIDRFHASVTISNEFTATAGGNSGVSFYRSSVTQDYDVALVTQVEGERCYRPILSAGSATATNDELLSWVWTVHATQNQGSFVFDFIPKAETAIGVNYLGGALWVYRNGGNAALYSYDGTTASSFGDQIEGARTTLAGSWETGVGRYGYRDGVAKFSGTSYDGAWLSTSMLIYGPQLLKSLQIYPEALTPAQLAAISAL